MKVSELIAALQAAPMDSDVHVRLGDDFVNFEVSVVDAGVENSGDVLVCFVPDATEPAVQNEPAVAKTKSLLEHAREVKHERLVTVIREKYTAQHVQLVVACLRGEISQLQVGRVIGQRSNNVSAVIVPILRFGVRNDLIEIVFKDVNHVP